MNSVIYLHDGTFEGMLSAVATAVKSNIEVQGIYAENSFSPQLFDTITRVSTNRQQAHRLMDYLRGLRGDAARFAVNGYLSDDRDAATHLYIMVQLCLANGGKVTRLYTNDSIRYLSRLSRRVNFEAHRFTGLIRFRILEDGLQYAPFEPDCIIIGHLALHCKRRFANQHWILHDIRRNLALYWDNVSIESIDIDDNFTQYVQQHREIPGSRLSDTELHYQKLWQSFHGSIANKERSNRALQRQFMPKRYWKYLVEMKRE